MKKLLLTLSLLLSLFSPAQAAVQQLLQLVDYVGVDYAAAIEDGVIISPPEYQEMQDFSAAILELMQQLKEGDSKSGLIEQAQQLADMVEQRVAVDKVASLTGKMRLTLINSYQVTVVPRKVPDLQHGQTLFSNHCASCHGEEGLGDGAQAMGMEPAPTNFTDHERYRQRTLYGLYNTITQGVADTGMRGYGELSDHDRWSLAFFAGQLAVNQNDMAVGEQEITRTPDHKLSSMETLTITTPAEAEKQSGSVGTALMAYLRTHPDKLGDTVNSPLQFSRERLADSLVAYQKGDKKQAYKIAVEAYLEGFELVEQGLDAVDGELRLDVEKAMTTVRNNIRAGKPVSEVAASVEQVDVLLLRASDRLSSRSLTGGAAFASAFFILLREGLEALLVVAALAAFLVKTNRRDGMRYLHLGWLGALGLGFLTWLASVTLINISGASREITEGVAALLAAAVLLYVGFWLHDKTHAAQWKRFIDDRVKQALSSGTLWGIAGLSFIAVYREVFETILFYQALWMQVDVAGKSMALSGFGTGIVVLAILAWLVIKYSVKLPLRQFFSFSGILMFVLAIIFAGKGVAALQEAGYIPVSPINFPRIDLLGIYPNLQGLLLQAAVLLLGLYLFYGMRGKHRAMAAP